MANYRNPKLLEKAHECPSCTSCGCFNAGNVVAAHSNQLRDGKGKGIKAHDYRIAFLCEHCHFAIDQGATLSREERRELWEEAHRKTMAFLFEQGHLQVKK